MEIVRDDRVKIDNQSIMNLVRFHCIFDKRKRTREIDSQQLIMILLL